MMKPTRRSLFKALGALPFLGTLTARADPTKGKPGITPPETARKIAEDEIHLEHPAGPYPIWINGRYSGQTTLIEVKNEPIGFNPNKSIKDLPLWSPVSVFWQGVPLSDRDFHDFTGVLVRTYADGRHCTFHGHPCNQSYNDDGEVCLVLSEVTILEFSSP